MIPIPIPTYRVRFPFSALVPEGVVLLREGHFPKQLFSYLLEYDEIDVSSAKPARYPISPQIRDRFAGTELRGAALRKALLDYYSRLEEKSCAVLDLPPKTNNSKEDENGTRYTNNGRRLPGNQTGTDLACSIILRFPVTIIWCCSMSC